MVTYNTMAERQNTPPAERLSKIDRLKEKFDHWGVSVIAWDLDGTLINTTKIFDEAITDACDSLKVPEEKLRHIIGSLRPEFGVSPAIMELSTSLLARSEGFSPQDDNFQFAIKRMYQLYNDHIPQVFPGAIEAVDFINRTGIKPVLMTHAEEGWTWHKKIGAKLFGKFANTACFSIDRPKSEQWSEQFHRLDINPETVLVIGDNQAADIDPVLALGGRGVLVINGRQRIHDAEPVSSRPSPTQQKFLKVDFISDLIPARLTAPSVSPTPS